jgi:hypothetical protein
VTDVRSDRLAAPPEVVWGLVTNNRPPSGVRRAEEHHQADRQWVSFPSMKDAHRGKGGKVIWGYTLEPSGAGTRLEHHMTVLEPKKGAWMLKSVYAVMSLPKKQREGGLTTLNNIKVAAETEAP